MVYGTVQQMLRLSANSPQVQITGDFINKLNSGIAAKSLILPEKIEISQSLAPFVIILDQNKNILTSSATLDGKTPLVPQGTFDWVTANGQDRVTWQPRMGIREAMVIDKYSFGSTSGFVVVGRSLKETELTIDKIGKDILAGWVVINIFAVVSVVFLEISRKK
jgi:hypothetical protein